MNQEQAARIVENIHNIGEFQDSYDLFDYFVKQFNLRTEEEIESFGVKCGFIAEVK